MRYAIVIEQAAGNYSAYVPDLPGCVATGDSPASAEEEIRKAILLHIAGMLEDGMTPPRAATTISYVDVTA